MRMIVPPLALRRVIDRGLSVYFRTHKAAEFRRAVGEFCRFYGIKRPRIEWYEYIDWGKTAGKTYENGRIHLIHPENWKRGRIYKTERMWVQTFYHEMGHFLFWTDAERKADTFTRRMVRGLRRAAATRGLGRAVATGSRRTSAASSRRSTPIAARRSGGRRLMAGKRQAARARNKVRVKAARRTRARAARA
ncbi:MAG TPA: hypothetical protein VKB84_24575 [Candidatus Binataceae bacterium]|nr:hypothetical protein [Candidatus Binataceae bacterium]